MASNNHRHEPTTGFANSIATFLCTVQLDVDLPAGFEVLNPYADAEVRRVVVEFCKRYYSGDHRRQPIWGINPGRFGGGVTGLSFTDPVSLSTHLGIGTTIVGRRELSAQFIEQVIDAYGGPQTFYRDVYLGALSPLGFVRQGVNINFYDDKGLSADIAPFIQRCLETQIRAGLVQGRALLLGSGALVAYVRRFLPAVYASTTIVALDHPRYIMQYRRRHIMEYVARYVDAIHTLLES